MKIVFEGSEYQLSNLSELQKVYPESSRLIRFILDWQNKSNSFQLLTSGSTGSPKIIDVDRKQIVASVEATSQYLSLKSNLQVLSSLDPNFIAAVMMVARCLILDMNLILERPTANPLKGISSQIDFASFVPIQIYKMIDEGNIDRLSEINNVLIGGAPLSQSAFERLTSLDTNIYVTYGMTETLSHIALMRIKGNFTEARFEVLPGVSIDSNADKCLNVKGKVTNNQWVQTNDIVEIFSENQFRWLGRADHVINSGGVKIHPEQLEMTITSKLQLKTNYLISWIKDEVLGSTCCLITEGEPLSIDGFERVQKVVEQSFSKYHIPKFMLTVKEFIKTDSGKIRREETRLQALNSI
ncbi:MAG: AMP-binding protein [Reichenbachiella sp.]|uniref:AMP-binding protein n=2 Tax=Reichenbachiella sp. TaxID=2184521 RepID=UPI003267F0DA